MASNRLRDPSFLNGNSSRSFKDALAGSSLSSSSFPYLKISLHRGLPALLIFEAEINALTVPFEFALVGKFPNRRPSIDAIRKFFFNLKLNGECSVTVLNPRHVLIKLVDDLDYCRVFSYRSYFVNNCYMKLVKWSPTLDVKVDSPIIHIWISFPQLRPHLFSPRILHGLGSIFGRPLKTDNATSTGSRPSIARVLMVVMDEFPPYCAVCKSLGHSKLECRSLNHHLKTPPTINHPINVNVMPSSDCHNNIVCDEVLTTEAVVRNGGEVVLLTGNSEDVTVGAHTTHEEQENMATLVEGDVDCLNTDNLVSPNVALLEKADANLISDGLAVESSSYGFNVTHGAVAADPSSNDLNVVQGVLGNKLMNVGENELCEVNMKVVSIDFSELDPSVASPVMPTDLVMLVHSVGLGVSEQLVDVPVTLLSTKALYGHVGVRSGESVKAQIDWLGGSSSSPSEVDEDDVFEKGGVMRDTIVRVEPVAYRFIS
ncbi:hypothetical protein M5K25_025450 [Dendrobium thyrsiflorum]|uniref:DUF4283 domain-containing protein n=1 Tax=Dendrobium thyrsiflorum TaxID=117978 RepID=A0ABD0U4A2_DENTH